jgi:hypothetical protein
MPEISDKIFSFATFYDSLKFMVVIVNPSVKRAAVFFT